MLQNKKREISDSYQIIGAIAHPDLFCVLQLPVSIRLCMNTLEFVPALVMMRGEKRIGKPGLLVHEIITCRIDGHRIL